MYMGKTKLSVVAKPKMLSQIMGLVVMVTMLVGITMMFLAM